MASTLSVQHRIYNQLAPGPDEGPRTIRKSYPLVTGVVSYENLSKEILEKQISFVQTIFFDTTALAGSVILTFYQSEQVLTLPPLANGYLPVLAGQEPHFSMVTAGAGGTLNLNFINVPMPALIWKFT